MSRSIRNEQDDEQILPRSPRAGGSDVLTPGRYVGAEDVEEDGTPFPERFAALQATLEEQFAESARLTEVIRQRLADVIVPAE